MKNTFLWLYGLITLLIAIVISSVQPTQRKLLQEATNVFEQSPSFTQKIISDLRSNMIENIDAFPEYHEYLAYAKEADILFQYPNNNLNDTLFDYLQRTFTSNEIENYKISPLDSFIYFNNRQDKFYQSLRQQLIRKKYLAVNNLFGEKTNWAGIACSWRPEIIFAPNQIIRPNETVKIEMGLSESTRASGQMRIAVNGEYLPVKDGKATYKRRATTVGLNHLDIQFTEIYKGKTFEKNLKTRFLVCE